MKNLYIIITIAITSFFLFGCDYKKKNEIEHEERIEAAIKEAEKNTVLEKQEIENLNELLLTPKQHNKYLNIQ